MTYLTRTLALLFILICAGPISAQSQQPADILHPEVQRYVNTLGLDAKQTAELQAVYESTTLRGQEVDAEIAAQNIAQREEMKTATPSDKSKAREKKNELSKERKQLYQERKDALDRICTEEQKAILESRKD